MKLTILGPHGGELPGCRSTCFLIDDRLALDAGALTQSLDLEALGRIDDILLTHSHFDHVKDLPMLSDVLVSTRARPVTIHGNRGCIATLQKHLFNDVLWPDFTVIPSPRRPTFRLRAFKAGAAVKVGGYAVKSVPVAHPVESCGYLISDGASALGISGDTGPTERLWSVFNGARALKAVLVECSFPDALQALADLSGHLTPSSLEQELKKLRRPDVKVLLYHLKPAFLAEIKAQVAHLDVHVLELDEQFEL
jgi:cAMP phosphodiesterase